MKTLIVEDDFTSRLLLQELLKRHGTSHTAVNGNEAVLAARIAREAHEPYDLICLDIMMPEKDGQTALREIRAHEESRGILSNRGSKIVMTTAMSQLDDVSRAFSALCDGYLVKPIDGQHLLGELRKLELIA